MFPTINPDVTIANVLLSKFRCHNCFYCLTVSRYLTEKVKVPWNKIVLYGRSLGTGASTHLASKRKVRGLILQSGLLSIHRVGLNLRLTLPGDMFSNIDKVSVCVFARNGSGKAVEAIL